MIIIPALKQDFAAAARKGDLSAPGLQAVKQALDKRGAELVPVFPDKVLDEVPGADKAGGLFHVEYKNGRKPGALTRWWKDRKILNALKNSPAVEKVATLSTVTHAAHIWSRKQEVRV